jgi:L-alanine-DL-glutamate epimerase-like enolase superfamily enzyme
LHHDPDVASLSRIARVSARRLDIPLTKPFGISGGAQHVAANVLVEVALEGGLCGWGEGAPFPAFNGETQEQTLAACSRAEVCVVGVDVNQSDDLSERLGAECAASPSARCAIETAILDCQAKLRGTSIRELLGGAQMEVVTDITITTGTLDAAERDARAFADFGMLKVKVGGGSVDLDVARVLAIRRVRPDARILIDANGGFSVGEAVEFARGVVVARIELFEQPIPAGDWEALAEVRRRTGLRIAIDESLTRASDVVLAKAHGAADAVNAKIMKSGVFEAVRIAQRAREEGLIRMIGGMVETRLAMGTSASIAAGLGGFAYVDLDTPLFLADDPFDGGYVQQSERIDLRPVRLGHGMEPRLRR